MEILSGPASVIVEASKAVVTAADGVTDPIDRARALENASRNIPHLQQQIRLARAAAIREALEQRSAVDVAAELGISRTRLYKILDGA